MPTVDLHLLLPTLLPKAIEWAESVSAHALERGVALKPHEIAVARIVGVRVPERVRVLRLDTLPLPDDAMLRDAALTAGLLGPGMAGLTLGHAVLVCRGEECVRLLSHELRHVHQYERAGSIAAFLPSYLEQVVGVGYRDAPFEVDAREHELASWPARGFDG